MQTVIIPEKTDNDIAIDYIICPHCGSEMLRCKMDNPYTINGRVYQCHNCFAEEIVSPLTEKEYFEI